MICFIPGESVRHLPGDPLDSGIGSDADRDQSPAGMTQDHQAVERLERDGAYDEQIQRSDAGRVITQESLPTLGWWSAAPDHIPAYGRFSDVDAKHQQFAVDPRCTPQRALAAHPLDQRSRLAIDPWTAAHVAGLPAPVSAEAASVPADHGPRLDDDDRVQERRVQSIQQYLQQAIDVPQSHARRGLALQNCQLLAQEKILGLKPRSPCELRPDSKQLLAQKRDRAPLHYYTPTRASSRTRFDVSAAASWVRYVADSLRRKERSPGSNPGPNCAFASPLVLVRL